MSNVKDWNELVADEKIASQKIKIAELEQELAREKMILFKMLNDEHKNEKTKS